MKARNPSFRGTWLIAGLIAGMALAAVVLLPVTDAAAAVGAWAEGQAKVRLVASGIDADGRLSAGIEIIMPPGWKTYWRSPGGAGVAPLIDFSASRNVRGLEVGFPAPHRYDDGYSVTNVYEDRVVFPVSGLVEDRARPVELVLDLAIGVCREICIPDQFDLQLSVPAGEQDAAAESILAEARQLLPQPAQPGVISVEQVVRDGGTDRRPVFTFTAIVPEGEDSEIFVEGPPDWSPYVPQLVGKTGDYTAYRVKFSRLGAETPIEGATFRVTIVTDDGRAVEDTVALD